jgi:hypothetical protein
MMTFALGSKRSGTCGPVLAAGVSIAPSGGRTFVPALCTHPIATIAPAISIQLRACIAPLCLVVAAKMSRELARR